MSQSYDVKFSSPLEIKLEELLQVRNSHNDFPHCGVDRFDLYKSIKSKLNSEYYRDIDGALTKDSNGGAYTHHDLGHVDDVIRKAGQLLGAGSDANTPAITQLKPYEVFVLLVACLIHDAGNIDGRKGHAARARQVLREVSDGRLDQKEISLISRIAKAHGGTAADGTKDTIGELPIEDGVENSKVRPRVLAAVLRLADELAENNRRASSRHSEGSEFANGYCRAISIRVDYESRRISLDFAVTDDDCKKIGKDESGSELYFLDYIGRRVSKAELERRYCDRFLRGFATFEEMRVAIELVYHDEEWERIHFELKENGYPEASCEEVVKGKGVVGSEIARRYEALCASRDHDTRGRANG